MQNAINSVSKSNPHTDWAIHLEKIIASNASCLSTTPGRLPVDQDGYHLLKVK